MYYEGFLNYFYVDNCFRVNGLVKIHKRAPKVMSILPNELSKVSCNKPARRIYRLKSGQNRIRM